MNSTDNSDPEPGDYRVLARKYRPSTFDELIGQDAMVRTLRNAIESGRLAHAFILSGVRGIGKTTTARLIARALNCTGDGIDGPTTSPCGQCQSCQAIAESRDVDVLEMDAASHTGVDDIREIIDAVRYAPVSSRYKVYIIDEVHMLSRSAFNALLKTLEEPPPHVKFVFATTEIRKVPVTVLSRCQRFDLRRVESDILLAHLRDIAAREDVAIEDEALGLIVRAADGSVRDGLSLLDQAIAHGSGTVTGAEVGAMLGLADRAQIFVLFDSVMCGDIAAALRTVEALYKVGAEPSAVIRDLLEITHWITRLKVAPKAGDDPAVAELERIEGGRMAAKLAMPVLSRAWQMLLKGLDETQRSPAPLAAAEMVLIRLAYVSDLPTPADLVRELKGAPKSEAAGASPGDAAAVPDRPSPPAPAATVSSRGAGGREGAVTRDGGAKPAAMAAPAAAPEVAYAPQPRNFTELVALAESRHEPLLYTYLHDNVRLVRFQPGRLEINPGDKVPANMVSDLSRQLRQWTGERWIVTVSREAGEPTLFEQETAARDSLRDEVSDAPLVRAVLTVFPGATISDIRETGAGTGATVTTLRPDRGSDRQ